MEGREVAAVGVFGQQQHDAARQWEALAAQYSSRLPVAICRSDGVLQQYTGPQGGSAPLLLVKGPGVMEWAVWRGSMERAEHWLDQQLRGQLPAVTEAILSSSATNAQMLVLLWLPQPPQQQHYSMVQQVATRLPQTHKLRFAWTNHLRYTPSAPRTTPAIVTVQGVCRPPFSELAAKLGASQGAALHTAATIVQFRSVTPPPAAPTPPPSPPFHL
jgi:hypothetical protein